LPIFSSRGGGGGSLCTIFAKQPLAKYFKHLEKHGNSLVRLPYVKAVENTGGKGLNKLGLHMVKKNSKHKSPTPLAPRELAAIQKLFAGRQAHASPSFKVSDNKVSLDHPDELIGQALLMEAVGTADFDFYKGLISQLANVGSGKDAQSLNFVLSVVKGIEPRDQLEAMLGAQMAAVHMATMKFARQLANVEYLQEQDSAERAFNKLTRTFVSQIEALKRYRTGGEQKVTVQHVSVSEGRQAIVGNVTQTSRGAAPEAAQSTPAALSRTPTPPMPVVKDSAATVVPLRQSAKGK
jgi:hypothetical protein